MARVEAIVQFPKCRISCLIARFAAFLFVPANTLFAWNRFKTAALNEFRVRVMSTPHTTVQAQPG